MAQYVLDGKKYRLTICGAETKGGRSLCCGIPKDKNGRCSKHGDADLCEDVSDPETLLARTHHKYRNNASLIKMSDAWILQINKCGSPNCSQMVTEIAKDPFCIRHSKLLQERDSPHQKTNEKPKRAIDDDEDADAADILNLLSDESRSSQDDEDVVSQPRSTKTRKVSETHIDEPLVQPPRKKSPSITPVPVSSAINFVIPSTLVPSISIPVKAVVPASHSIKAATPAPAPVKAATPAPAPVKAATPAPAPVKAATPAPAPVKAATPAPPPVKAATPAPAPVKAATPAPHSVKAATPGPPPVKAATPAPPPVKAATIEPDPVKAATVEPDPVLDFDQRYQQLIVLRDLAAADPGAVALTEKLVNLTKFNKNRFPHCDPGTIDSSHIHLHTIIATLSRFENYAREKDELLSNQLAALSDEVRELKKQKADASSLPPQAVELMLAMLQKK